MDNSMDWVAEDVFKWLEDTSVLDSKCTSISTDMISQRTNILEIVEKLGPILTHEDVDQRRKGVQFLSHFLSRLPDDLLVENQLKFILAFYNDRLRDHHSLVPHILSGINTLSRMKNAAQDDVLRLLFTILSGTVITCQSQQREERCLIFDLIIHCSVRFYATLRPRKNDYIQGVINAIEGERDPRNLVKLFDFMPKFIEMYPLDHWADEMFEVFACYYPIDFYPSPNDPNAITRDGLSNKLGQCLLACKDFLEPALVLALEKLETDLKVAKLDSLTMIRDCARKFGCEEIEGKFDNIWMGLKQELLPGQNDDVIRAALEAVSVIVAEAKEHNTRTNILTVIFNSIAISLCDVNLRLFYPALRVGNTLGNASREAAVYVGDKVTPILLRQLRDCAEEDDDKRRTLLGLLKDIVSIANSKDCLRTLDKEVISDVEIEFMKCLSHSSNLEHTIGYFGLTEIFPVTQPKTRTVVYERLLDSLITGTSTKLPVTSCVTRFMVCFPHEVNSELVKPLLKNTLNFKNCSELFNILTTIIGTCEEHNTDIYNYLLQFIFVTSDVKLNMSDDVEGDPNSLIMLTLLKTLNNLLQTKGKEHVANHLYNSHNLVKLLVESRSNFKEDVILRSLTTLLTNILQCQTKDEQQKVLDAYLPQLKVSSKNDLYFIAGLLSRCPKQVSLSCEFEKLVPELVKLSLSAVSVETIEVADKLLCFLFNFTESSESFNMILQDSTALIEQAIRESGQGIRTFAWITKGLLTRGHPVAEKCIIRIISALSDPTLASSAANAMECLARSPEIYLANQRMFFKQQLFDLVNKTLVISNVQLDAVQLRALSRVMSELSPVVLRMHLATMGPILFRCLDDEDPQTIHTGLKLFHRLIETDAKFCQDHIQFLIPQFLKLAQMKRNLQIRILALQCLLRVCTYPTYLLIPFKQDVLYSTIAALDDHKRLVRAAAVEARTKWCLIDSPIKEK